jgi:hypothetical protein
MTQRNAVEQSVAAALRLREQAGERADRVAAFHVDAPAATAARAR